MSGTKAGGLKAAATCKKKFGKDFYKRQGRIGGMNGHTGGFAANPELAKTAGAKGGKNSKRDSAKTIEARVNKILKLYQKGYDAVDIAKKLHINATAVRYHLNRNVDITEYLEKHNG